MNLVSGPNYYTKGQVTRILNRSCQDYILTFACECLHANWIRDAR